MHRTYILHIDTHVASYTQDVCVCVCVQNVCLQVQCPLSANTAICSQMYVELPSFRLHRNQCCTAMAKLGICATFCYEHPKKIQ